MSGRSKWGMGLAVTLLMVGVWFCAPGWPGEWDAPRIFTARRIITIDPAKPFATAVAVADGRITAVGSLDEVRAAVGQGVPVDERFADKVLLPGFIDPHIHPSLAATILPLEIVSAMEWVTPSGRTRAVRGREAYLARLRELELELAADADDADEWLVTWGYHEPYHGSLARADLDAVSSTRPILVWQRSVHEMIVNTAALEASGIEQAAVDAHPAANWEEGHFWETGLFVLGRPFLNRIAKPASYRAGLAMMTEVLHRGGLTTVGEQGFPQMSGLAEWLALYLEMRKDSTPYRFVMVPNAMYLLAEHGDAEKAERAAARMLGYSTDRIQIVKHVKYYADGAIFSQLMQMSEPYLDGHQGEWMMTPEEQASVLEAFAQRGWNVHVHVNGDAGLDLVLDQVEAVSKAHPDSSRRVVMEHYGYAREDQHARLKALGVDVSNNAYYLYELAPIYAEHGLGAERAAHISPLGGVARAGVPISFHSDFPMAPAEPLRQIAVAVNRVASDGKVWGENERLSLDLALRAVTLEAARSLGLEDEIGSIRPGKKADFTVLNADPLEVDSRALEEIGIWGTVFEGRPFPIR